MPGWVHRFFRRAVPHRADSPFEIDVSRYGLAVERCLDGWLRPRPKHEVVSRTRWTDVQSIHAFKRDRVTVDQVCLAFDVGGGLIELNEDMDGYDALVGELPKRFPGLDVIGLRGVVLPPFTANWRELWRQPPPDLREPPGDRQLAASLWVALYTGMLTHGEVVALVDKEIDRRPSPEPWLIDASLESAAGLSGSLLRTADGHPMLEDDLARLDASGRVVGDGRFRGVGGDFARFMEGNLPSEVRRQLIELDLALAYLSETNGPAENALVDREFRELMAAVRRWTPWTEALDRIQPERPVVMAEAHRA